MQYRIQYDKGYHGYDSDGNPALVDRAQAALFESEHAALAQVSHDLSQFDFGGDNFRLEECQKERPKNPTFLSLALAACKAQVEEKKLNA